MRAQRKCLMVLKKQYMCKKDVVVLIEYYLPGFKSGGPLRTIDSIVKTCHDDFNFKIITKDRDSGDLLPYHSVNLDDWNI